MHVAKKLTALSCIVFIGCGSDITPTDGAWSATNLTFEVNECGMDDVSGQTLPLYLSVTSDNLLELTLDEDMVLTCVFEKGAFDCDPLDTIFDMNDTDGIDAIMVARQTFSGAFSTEHDGSVTWNIEYTCTGTQCEEFLAAEEITVPCTTTANGTLTHSGM